MLLILTLTNYSKAILIIRNKFTIFLPHLIPFIIVPFTISYAISIFIMGNIFTINHNHLQSFAIIEMMLSFIIDLDTITIFIIFYLIIVCIILYQIAEVIILLLCPFYLRFLFYYRVLTL
jgi:hypothetical protein